MKNKKTVLLIVALIVVLLIASFAYNTYQKTIK